MSKPVSLHARYGVCAICNHADWVVPEYKGETFASDREVCDDHAVCASRVFLTIHPACQSND